NGLEAGFQAVTAGNAASIKNTGSITSFGGGSGGQLKTKSEVVDNKYTYTYSKAESGGGGNSAPGTSEGGVGGNGQVIIVITYYE
ncbi:MAG: hypothetical protein FWF51_03900, partial [Chitinivibrionia bacterium]|nr:hypothetical protein [Chitinivibrionia bacterium]